MTTPKYIVELRAKINHTLLMMPGVTAFIQDDQGRVLLQRRVDNDQWVLPGGALEPDEHPGDAVIREVWEETGLTVVPERIIGVYAGSELHHFYPNEDEVQLVAILFACRMIGGELTADNDNESLETAFFALDAIPSTIMPRHLTYLEQAVKNDPAAHFRFEGTVNS